MKKLLLTALLLFAISGLMTACGDDDDDSGNDNSCTDATFRCDPYNTRLSQKCINEEWRESTLCEETQHCVDDPYNLYNPPTCAEGSLGGTAGDWYHPPVALSWQWQLSGDINDSYDVDLYDIDLFDTPKETIALLQQSGKKVICYFSGGSFEDWRPDKDEFDAKDLGNDLDGWEGEQWLDIRSQKVREIMKTRLDIAVILGCDGVEPDNMDGYINDSGFPLTAADQIAFNRFMAQEAHARHLAVGLKNDLDQIEALVNYFDFSVNEQCFEYDECEMLSPFIKLGKPVLNAEYKQKYHTDENARNGVCSTANDMQFSTLILPLNLDDSFRFDCTESVQ